MCMLSLAGFPPTGGFLGKLYIFSAAVQNGQTYLAVAGVIATMVGLVYYLRVPFALYDRDVGRAEGGHRRRLRSCGGRRDGGGAGRARARHHPDAADRPRPHGQRLALSLAQAGYRE